jgi:hypothetical protein
MRCSAILAALLLALPAAAEEKRKVPDRQIPESVLAGLQMLERQFTQALTQDCAPERCFAKGCVYVSHLVVDRPATTSLPGLGLDPGPGDGDQQVYLTTAECTFAHERTVRAKDARALATRLKAKLSRGWTQVDVTYEKLQPLPDFMRESPEPPPDPEPEVFDDPDPEPAPEAKPTPPPPEWNAGVASRELWENLLPHFAWMLGLLLVTCAALLLIWALRRLGRTSPEEQALLAQLVGGGADADTDADADDEEAAPEETAEERISEQHRIWRERLARSGEEPDPALLALVTDLLRTGERRLLAKAVTLFPEAFPKAFPTGGSMASAKFELAEFLKHADAASLPSDAAFFDTLNRYAMSAALTAHPDTDLIRSLHDEFGASALVDLVGTLPPRHAALLFALAPEAMQHEAVGRLSPPQTAEVVAQLMESNRMDPAETDYLLGVLSSLREGSALPNPPERRAVSDRGAEFNATGALSILLPRLNEETRAGLVESALARHGQLPAWMQGTLYGEMLLRLDDETRTDLLLEVHVDQLSAWLAVQSSESRAAILDRSPNALRAAVSGSPRPTSDGVLHALANDGRAALTQGLQARLARGGVPFQALLA